MDARRLAPIGRSLSVLVVFCDPEAIRNRFVRSVYAAWNARLDADARLSVTRAPLESSTLVGEFDVVINLSPASARRIADAISPPCALVDLHYHEASSVSAPLSALASDASFVPGQRAAIEDPSTVAISATMYSANGFCGTIGQAQYRSQGKSARLAEEPLAMGSYLVFEMLAAAIASGTQWEDYVQLERAVPTRLVPSVADNVLTFVRYSLLWGFRTLVNQRARGRTSQWSVAIGQAHDDPTSLPGTLTWLSPDPGSFLADPFLVNGGPVRFLFMEELRFSDWKGFIVVVPVGGDGSVDLNSRKVALDRPYHLSFPNVFEVEGEHFMLPEQASTGRVELYRATQMPEQWVSDSVLLDDCHAVDPVLLLHEGHWYLFTSDARHGNADNHLQLFVATDFRGPFTRHPSSPIRFGLRGSRMAGAIQRSASQLLRLGQNCETRYGGGICVFEIRVLTPAAYEEVFVRQIDPLASSPYPLGIHTISHGDGMIAVDGLREIEG